MGQKSTLLNEAIVKVYTDLISDPDCPQHLKLGAAKALDAHLARADQQDSPVSAPDSAVNGDEQAPDPFAELDEVERARNRRASA